VDDSAAARGEDAGLSGLMRAAVLAQVLGEEAAAQIFRHLGAREAQKLASAIKDLSSVPQAQVESVVNQFVEKVGLHSNLGIDAERYLRDVLVRAHGEDKATGIMDRITLGGDANGLENLKWMDARQVAEIVRDEHPQVKAIVLSYLEPDHAAAVLDLFPDRVRPDVVLRIATLDAVQPAALRELNRMLESQAAGSRNVQTAAVGGLKRAADILNFVETSAEAAILEVVKEHDADLGQQIQDLMFVFDNLQNVDPAGIQVLLREVASDSLLLALKGADDALRDHFFHNMSRRAAEMMRDDLEAKGPVRVSEVEAAQKEILTIARRLAEDGQIALGGQGADEYL
jgi:flagellar motor switch protein FliG